MIPFLFCGPRTERVNARITARGVMPTVSRKSAGSPGISIDPILSMIAHPAQPIIVRIEYQNQLVLKVPKLSPPQFDILRGPRSTQSSARKIPGSDTEQHNDRLVRNIAILVWRPLR